MQRIILGFFIVLVGLTACTVKEKGNDKSRPNIIWITVEDMNNWMGCYGDSIVPTPNIDNLALEGTRFDRAYMSAGVCSASRSAIALGTMQTSLGVHNHRSSRQRTEGDRIELPSYISTVYKLMRDNGYFVLNAGPKNDFNFLWADSSKTQLAKAHTSAYYSANSSELLYDVNTLDWASNTNILKDLPNDKPLFLQLQLKGGKNSGKFNNAGADMSGNKKGRKIYTDTSAVDVMPYYPDIPVVRNEIAHHYDCIRQTDDELGKIISVLKEEGIYDNSVIFFWTDHGMVLPRHKQWLYEGGVRVPLIVAGDAVDINSVRSDLVSGIDITVSTLALAGAEIPEWMEGEDMFSPAYSRDYVVSARDRCDYTIDKSRAITTERFRYIRNFLTDRPFSQPQYRDSHHYMKELSAYYEEGKMNDIQSFIWQEERLPEELYDIVNDPHEINNLVNDPDYAVQLDKHRKILDEWIKETGDKGMQNEDAAVLEGCWSMWKDKAVNPEFDVFMNQ